MHKSEEERFLKNQKYQIVFKMRGIDSKWWRNWVAVQEKSLQIEFLKWVNFIQIDKMAETIAAAAVAKVSKRQFNAGAKKASSFEARREIRGIVWMIV